MRTRVHLIAALGLASPAMLHPAGLAFNRAIRPILAEHCFACHGPDAKARKAGLRLDLRDEALKPAKSGAVAIVPGDPAKSELVARVTASDPDDRMPPPDSHKNLSTAQIDALRRWIEEGAVYEKHWAFEPLVKAVPPDASSANPIDVLVEEKLREHGMRFAPEASREALLRRVSLNLTGLPPTIEEMRAYLADASPHAYERVVDRLLNSSHFGEHIAVAWLDAARYADTNGYFGDKPRQMWLWRDWVISAFNANMPFDQFTLEQLAGDLLYEQRMKNPTASGEPVHPSSSIAQPSIDLLIATGFNRNHMANNESGIIDEEFRAEYVVDRVDTTMTTWLGLTAGCAQCHDHKYDPISQRDFYSLFAFFNNVPESGLIKKENPPPLIEVPSPEQQKRLIELTAESREAADAFEPMGKALAPKLSAWEKEAPATLPAPPRDRDVLHEAFDGQPSSHAKALGTTLVFQPGVRGKAAEFDATRHLETNLRGFEPDGPWSIGLWLNAEGSLSCPLSMIAPAGDRRGLELIWQKGRLQVNLVHRWGASAIEVSTVPAMSAKTWHHVVVSHGGSPKAASLRVFVDGKPAALEVRRDTLDGTIANSEPVRVGRRDQGLGYYGLLDELRVIQRAVGEKEANDWFHGERIRGIIEAPSEGRSANDARKLLEYYVERFAGPEVRAAHERVKDFAQMLEELRATVPTVLIMQEMDRPRGTHVLERGRYDKPGALVEAAVPTAIAPWPAAAPRNRLGLAQWLVSPGNPLTPRVAVNRLWQQCFGEGLVRTVNDFGTQGEPPTHPELLDWLAAMFRDSGWDVKALLRRIVTSRTYRQSSRFKTDGTQVVDPENRLLARGPAHRLSAEMLRDQALAVSGLLIRKLGGPGVKPYQPSGLWESVSYNGEESYVPDGGEGLWRRSVYTYVKRQAPPPMLLTFDGPTREKCTVRRSRTNTPLQALMLLNDETFVEAGRALGARAMKAPGNDESRLNHLCLCVLCRNANTAELAALRGLLQRQRERFAANRGAARELLGVGAAPLDRDLEPSEIAAWTVVAQTVLNLDEAITQR